MQNTQLPGSKIRCVLADVGHKIRNFLDANTLRTCGCWTQNTQNMQLPGRKIRCVLADVGCKICSYQDAKYTAYLWTLDAEYAKYAASWTQNTQNMQLPVCKIRCVLQDIGRKIRKIRSFLDAKYATYSRTLAAKYAKYTATWYARCAG